MKTEETNDSVESPSEPDVVLPVGDAEDRRIYFRTAPNVKSAVTTPEVKKLRSLVEHDARLQDGHRLKVGGDKVEVDLDLFVSADQRAQDSSAMQSAKAHGKVADRKPVITAPMPAASEPMNGVGHTSPTSRTAETVRREPDELLESPKEAPFLPKWAYPIPALFVVAVISFGLVRMFSNPSTGPTVGSASSRPLPTNGTSAIPTAPLPTVLTANPMIPVSVKTSVPPPATTATTAVPSVPTPPKPSSSAKTPTKPPPGKPTGELPPTID